MRPWEERALRASGKSEDLYEVAREYGYTGDFEAFCLQLEKEKQIKENKASVTREKKRNRELVRNLLW